MEDNESQTKKTLENPDQISTSLKNSGDLGNSQYRQRDSDRIRGDSVFAPDMATNLKEKESGSEEEEETEPERSSSQQRHHRGGRQEKRIIEESAYDPYCE